MTPLDNILSAKIEVTIIFDTIGVEKIAEAISDTLNIEREIISGIDNIDEVGILFPTTITSKAIAEVATTFLKTQRI